MYKIDKITNTIILGDCIQKLKEFPDQSVDLIFADPPYFMQTEGELLRFEGTVFNGVDDEWDKFDDYIQYDNFMYSVLKECRRVLKDDGTIWVIGAFQNIYRIGYILQNLGFWILNDVVWNKKNPVPNFKGTRFTNANEIMLWCSKSKDTKFTFNYHTMKKLNGGKQMRSVWDISLCNGSERLKDDCGNKLHNTQKPEELLYRVILSSSKVGDLVLDPFMGSGTTAAVAKRLGRNYVGIEREKKYVDISVERLRKVEFENTDLHNLKEEIRPIRVPMEELIRKEYLVVGEYLFDKIGNKFRLRENGYLQYENKTYSIHQLSRKILGRETFNGWDYWYVMRKNVLVSIDELRIKYRASEIEAD